MSNSNLLDEKYVEEIMVNDFQTCLDIKLDDIRSESSLTLDEVTMSSLRETSISSDVAGVPTKITVSHSQSDINLTVITKDETVQTLMSSVNALEKETERRQRDYQKQMEVQLKCITMQNETLKELESENENNNLLKPAAQLPEVEIIFFAVARGRKPGIYTSRDKVDDQIEGFSGALFKKCSSFSKAEEYLQNNSSTKDLTKDKISPPKEKESERNYFGVSSVSFSGVFRSLNEVPTSTMSEGKVNMFETAAEAVDWVKAQNPEVEQIIINNKKEQEKPRRNLAKYKSTSLIFKHAGKKSRRNLCA